MKKLKLILFAYHQIHIIKMNVCGENVSVVYDHDAFKYKYKGYCIGNIKKLLTAFQNKRHEMLTFRSVGYMDVVEALLPCL
jgi:hypothetical protein